ncbi:MAG: SDR family NAD(P)-dependent oxidoreductase, partial [Saprospiraceae bacterium]|nr:SDR family NAD(P)-dependent oxidoreductase [Saprospiraceae bacterium]
MKTALITGGSKGIGLGIAYAMVADGYHVALTSRNQSEVESAAAQINQMAPGHAMGLQVDVRDLKAQEDCVQAVIEKWGSLDVMIANAGVGHFAHIEDITPEQWNDVIDI